MSQSVSGGDKMAVAVPNKTNIKMAVGALWLLVVLTTCLLPAGVRSDTYDIRFGRHNITMGHRRVYPQYPSDILLFHDEPKVKGSWFPYPSVQSSNVCYPPKGSHPARFYITCFNVTDKMPPGDGGYAFVKEGGVNSGKLCLHLKTQRGGGYHFVINVWGYYL